jgi:hypothetical protein
MRNPGVDTMPWSDVMEELDNGYGFFVERCNLI